MSYLKSTHKSSFVTQVSSQSYGFPNPPGVPQGNCRSVPEGIREPVTGEQREGCSGYVDSRGWESDNWKHSRGNLNGMQNKGRSSTVVVLMGEHDKAITLEYDDTSVDMDISPITSPNNCTDLRSNLEQCCRFYFDRYFIFLIRIEYFSVGVFRYAIRGYIYIFNKHNSNSI